MITRLEFNESFDPTEIPFWADMDDDLRAEMLNLSLFSCNQGDQIVINPESRDGCFMVLQGLLRVFISSQSGREFTLFEVGPGNGCGLLPYESPVHPLVEALQDTLYYYVPLQMMGKMIAALPQWSDFFQFSVTGNLQTIVDNIESAFFSPLSSSVAHTLLTLCDTEDDRVKITHEEIANHIGTTREMVTREIRKLKADGLIKSGRGSITILDRDGLRNLSKESA